MKQKQRIALLGIAAVALIFAACDGDSGNNGTEPEGDSSSVAACTNTYGTNTVTDCRDGQTYRTLTIGTQTWMAQNLNYADSAALPNLEGNSWCYGNSADSCAKYGRLYTWTGAMNIDRSYQSASAAAVVSAPHQGACPMGWHIPTNAEWTILEDAVGGSSTAGTYLKATSGWKSYSGISNLDSYGFSALPAGGRYYSGSFLSVGGHADFWCATEVDTDNAYCRNLDHSVAYMNTDYCDKYYAFSVRCVQD